MKKLTQIKNDFIEKTELVIGILIYSWYLLFLNDYPTFMKRRLYYQKVI